MIVFDRVTLASASGGEPYVIDLTQRFQRGGVSTILGPSRSHSRILAAIIGLITPTQGTILVDGVDVAQDPSAVRIHSSFVPVHAPVLRHLTVREQVVYLTTLTGRRRTSRQVTTALRLSEVPDHVMRQRTSSLDPFQRVAVWLAVHRLRESRILLLEDPSEDLSVRQARSLARLIRETVEPNHCVVLTSRDPEFASWVADITFRIDRQRLVATSPEASTEPDPAAVLSRP